MSQGLPHLDFTFFAPQIFWLIVFFTILYFTFSKIVLPRIERQLKMREDYVNGLKKHVEKVQDEITRLNNDITVQLKQARSDAADIINAASQESSSILENAEKTLQQEISEELQNRISNTKALTERIDIGSVVNDVTAFVQEKLFEKHETKKPLKRVS